MDMIPGKITIGFIGLGVMGQSMAGHIVNAGYELHVYTRTKKKSETIIAQGGIWENSVPELSKKCDVIITIVGFPADVEAIYFGENGILNHAKNGSVVIDMTLSLIHI